MADDLQKQVLGLTYKGTETTVKILFEVISKALKDIKFHAKSQITTGEQSLKRLNTQGKQLESVDISNDDIKSFRKELNRYNVDFSIMKDKSAETQTIFFKGQDVDRIYKALEVCIKNIDLERSNKKPVKEKMQEAVNKAQSNKKEKSNEKGTKEKSASMEW
jgi:hypothetical protein